MAYVDGLYWPVFPLRGKKPLVRKEDGGKGYLDATTDGAQVRDWWIANPDANIGFCPGRVGLVVLDYDGKKGLATAKALGFPLESSLMCLTPGKGGGLHIYLRLPEGVEIGNVSTWDAQGINVRSSSGYVLLPPSLHPDTGTRYEWEGNLDTIALAADRVVDALTAAVPERVVNQLETRSATVTMTAVRELIVTRKLQGRSNRVITDEIDGRVRAYLAAVPAQGQGSRNNTAFIVARWLVSDFGLPEDTAFGYLHSWNSANQPPLSDRELTAVFESAKTHGQRAPGSAHEGRQ